MTQLMFTVYAVHVAIFIVIETVLSVAICGIAMPRGCAGVSGVCPWTGPTWIVTRSLVLCLPTRPVS